MRMIFPYLKTIPLILENSLFWEGSTAELSELDKFYFVSVLIIHCISTLPHFDRSLEVFHYSQ